MRGIALRRGHRCGDEPQSPQVWLSPDPQIPRTRVGCHTVGETKRRLSVPTQTPSPAPQTAAFAPQGWPGSITPSASAPVPCRGWGSYPLPPSPTFHASSHSPRVCFRHCFQPCSPRRRWDCIPTKESKSPCGGFKGLGRTQSSRSRDCSHPLTLSWNIERGRDP